MRHQKQLVAIFHRNNKIISMIYYKHKQANMIIIGIFNKCGMTVHWACF